MGAAVSLALAILAPAAALGGPAKNDLLKIADEMAAQPRPLPHAMVDLRDGVNAGQFAASYGLRLLRPMRSLPNAWLMAGPTVDAVAKLAERLPRDQRVEWVFQDAALRMEKHSGFTPNDPFYPYNSPSGYPGQWHLRNTNNLGSANIDVRVWNAWQRGVTGDGVIVGIIDDSVQVSHPDLAPGHSAEDSFDFGQNDADPSPVHSNDDHGTPVAGVAVARGGNGIGVTGAAPLGRLAGLRVDFLSQSVSQFVDATLHRSQGATTTIKIKNHSYGITVPYIDSASQVDALALSTAAGTIHVAAAGNDRGDDVEDVNSTSLQSSPDMITVAALAQDGRFSDYSSFGAAVFVTAPSDSLGLDAITTTDRTGSSGYNSGSFFGNADYGFFGGTSSASPLAAGVIALAKQVNPSLTTRFVKHLLARYSDVVDASDTSSSSDGGWRTNGAGFRFNQNYGFGLINADRLTQAAATYTSVTPLEVVEIAQTTVGATIPDDAASGVTRTFAVTSTRPLEEVLLTIDTTHTHSGDLTVFLTSPSGLTSRLVTPNSSGRNDLRWRYTTNAFWGENPQGTWTIRVADVAAFDQGTWNWFSASLRTGTIVRDLAITGVSLNPASVRGGRSSTGTVTLNSPAPTGGTVVSLASSNASATVPATVTVAAGATSAAFTVTTTPVTSDRTATITASRSGAGSAAASLTITRPAPAAITLNPRTVRGGSSSTATVTLDGAAPAGGYTVTLRSNRAEATVPATLVIPAGSSSGTFTVTTRTVGGLTYPTLYATGSSVTRFVQLTITPPIINTFTLNPTVVMHAGVSTGTVTIDEAAPAGGVAVRLRSTNTSLATVGDSVVIAQGATSATFPVQSLTVGVIRSVTLVATVGTITRAANLTIFPPLLTAMTASPTTLTGGQQSIVTLTIEGAAPAGGVRVSLRTSRSEATVAPTVTIPQGQTSTTFTVNTTAVTTRTSVLVYATIAGRSRFVTLTLNP